MEDNKKKMIITKYFSNQLKSNQKPKNYYSKINVANKNKPISNRQNINQISSVSKMYNLNGKNNKSINRSSLNLRHNSRDHS